MITITKEQAQNRFVLLPEPLQDAVFSIQNAEIISAIGQQYFIPEERMGDMASVVGWVLLGFLHPEDIKDELAEKLSIPKKTAEDISGSLNAKIFKALNPDLDKSYAPVPHEEEPVPLKSNVASATITSTTGPKIIQDIGPSVPVPAATPASTMQATSQTLTGSLSAKTVPLATKAMPSPAAAPKPVNLSDVGWSKTRMVDPIVKLDTSRMPPQAPVVASQPKPINSQQVPPMNKSLGEFERLNMMKTAPGAAPTPMGAGAPAGPAPMILHEDSSFKAAEKNTAFTLTRPTQEDADMHLGSSRFPAPTTKPAVLEFGKDAPTSGMPPRPPAAPTGNAVHYTQFNSSLSSTPTANSGPRNVGQVMPPAPMAPQSPTPSPVPHPSNAPQTPQGDVIVKNFP
jgi:hypothetical protein